MVGRGSAEVTVKRVAGWHVWLHLADDLPNDVRECLKDLDSGAEAIDQFPIIIAIFLEGPFSFMEELEDRIGRI
jgi:hypothetical protein